jgi:hypothetical protein
VKAIFVLGLTLAVSPGFSGERHVPLAPISLYTHFQEAPSETVQEALHDELESIMAPLGFRFEWRSLSEANGSQVSVELAVLTFKGRCNVANLMPRSNVPGALGWTHVSDGNILPFSDLECDRLRGFVQKELLAFPAEDREEVFGRALARVVAHELYHIFANTSQHGSCGVGKAAYTVQELLGEDFQFEARESLALRNSKAREILENAVRDASLE